MIGPNGCGKSNFIEVVALLRATLGDMSKVTQRGEGIKEWIWKGEPKGTASIDGVLSNTEGEFTIPATRLSDGTLRYLCLLAILCDPKPPPLICIEEPELGLHYRQAPTSA